MKDEIARLKAALALEGRESSDFDLNPMPEVRRGQLRPAAVLVPLWYHEDEARLILTKRASHLKHHPGQVAFPGGKQEAEDTDSEACALRETREEIGLPSGRVEILGRLPAHETVTGFSVVPVLGVIRYEFTPEPEAGEVDEVFWVPLSHVFDESRYRVERRIWRGASRGYYTVPYGPYYIWGATARILRGLADRVARCG